MNHVEPGQQSVRDYPPRLKNSGEGIEDMTIQPSGEADGPLADLL